MTMAELLAKQSADWQIKPISITRGSEIEGNVISITDTEIVLDLGGKSEGVLSKKDLPLDKQNSLKIGDKISAFVVHSENDSGQVLLGLNKAATSGKAGSKLAAAVTRFRKFQDALINKQTVKGKATELNKGGLVIEVDGIRGFLPTSQVTLTQAANLDEAIGKELTLNVIEVDPSQNRLIFSQKQEISDELKDRLSKTKVGDIVEGEIAAILPFGAFVSLENGLDGLIHISELSWEKVDDPNTILKVGDKVSTKVLSTDLSTGRVNLSLKQISTDPFQEQVKDYQTDDVIKAEITKVDSTGVTFRLDGSIEGFMADNKKDPDTEYEIGKSLNMLVDSIDSRNRRVLLAPFITSTKDLIYK